MDSVANLAQRMQEFVSKTTQTAELRIFCLELAILFIPSYIKETKNQYRFHPRYSRWSERNQAKSDPLLQ
jgi:hypothetical protein